LKPCKIIWERKIKVIRDKLIIALDVPTLEQGKRLVDQLHPYAGTFKVGLELYTAEGPRVIDMIKHRGSKIFVDLKFHDIPNTVAGAVRALVRKGVDMCTVHAAGGRAMLKAAVEASREEAQRQGGTPPKILAVTVLTSWEEKSFREEMGIPRSLKEQAITWALMAQKAGTDGVVASPWEVEDIRGVCGPRFIIVTPGIRPRGAPLGDQCRVMTPGEALAAGADYLVVGRAITAAPDPGAAARDILEEMLKFQ